jgi:hypothetical protein
MPGFKYTYLQSFQMFIEYFLVIHHFFDLVKKFPVFVKILSHASMNYTKKKHIVLPF